MPDDSREIIRGIGPITREHVFSPCYDENGEEYHLVVLIGRHGVLQHVKDAPLRSHGTGASVDLARAAALRAFSHATTSLRSRPPVSVR